MKMNQVLFLVTVLFLLAAAPTVMAADDSKAAADHHYPIATCIVSGEKLGSMGDPIKYDYKGREVQFCCEMCIQKFESDPDTYLKVLDQAIIDAQVEDYPLTTCVVSGNELGSMGDPYQFVYDNQLVQFCCQMCLKKFEQEPGKFMSKVDEAATTQAEDGKKPVLEKPGDNAPHNPDRH